MESPPKRMTRARAAAKATEPAVKTTKIVTAAAKAKSTATASTKSTAAKRKTRADDTENEDEDQLNEAPTTRKAVKGRPRKAAEPEKPVQEAAPVKATRGRPAKKPATESSKSEVAQPAKPTRGRPKKVVEPEPEESGPEPPKKTTRGRAAATTTRNAAKPTVKKTVTFEEPDKENLEPATKKQPPSTGIRGRPARRGGATAARSTRKTNKSTEDGEKKPLSPKKVTQIPVSRGDESEDELAAADYPAVKPMKKSPVKPPTSVMPQVKEQAPKADEPEDDDATTTINSAILNPPDLTTTAFGSPARRMPASALKETMRSPARKIGAVPFPTSAFKSASKPSAQDGQSSPTKNSLLMSAAKRPPSPIKGLSLGSPSKSEKTPSALRSSMLHSPAKRAMPGFKPLIQSPRKEGTVAIDATPAMKPFGTSVATPSSSKRPSEKLLMDHELSEIQQDEDEEEKDEEDPFTEPIENIKFPGRMSDVLPRDADPTVEELEENAQEDEEAPEPEQAAPQETEPNSVGAQIEEADEQSIVVDLGHRDEEPAESSEEKEDTMASDETVLETQEEHKEHQASVSADAMSSPLKAPFDNPNYQLRQEDLNPCRDLESESEDELVSPVKPKAKCVHISPRRESRRVSRADPQEGSRRSTIGFTALAEQFGSWSATSPAKESTSPSKAEPEQPAQEHKEDTIVVSTTESPSTSRFFEDEIQARSDAAPETGSSDTKTAEIEEPIFNDVMLTDEDFDLAQEANEMSLMEPAQAEERTHHLSHDDSLSDASQEYGDENQVPIDPAILSQPPAPVTPARPTRQRAFNTTTKVPLKPADESTPSPLKKRSFSASRVAPKRPTSGLSRSSTVISYSPEKGRRSSRISRRSSVGPSEPTTPTPTTPVKSDVWSSMGTPARTPHKDLDPALLRGAVVFVDVHTSEGADASGIFVELLTQMGARCMKTWTWNPSSPTTSDSTNKIGITHVVYKDGGKRTLEKVRQSKGVVQCVGVSWVLDCERVNEWLDEAPYYIDTQCVPRGGARRRKSMEPKSLSNMNGTLVDNNKSSSSREGQTPTTPMNRRQSTVWMHTPSDQGQEQEEDDIDWSKYILTPVPKTPAPEAIAKYAAEIPETPGGDDDDDMEDSPMKQSLLTRTCPPKSNQFREMGRGVLNEEKDEQVLMRLMNMRRKSLQFAPKIGSPLSRTWN